MKSVFAKKTAVWMLAALLLLSSVPVAGAEESSESAVLAAAKYFKLETGGSHTAVIKNDGSLWMCGSNYYGEIGVSDYKDETSVKQLVKVMDDVADVACGENHTLAVKKDGTLWAWGSNEYGQLGTGNQKDSNKPVQVKMPGGKMAADVEADYYYSAAVALDGTMYTWGLNTNGRLGQGNASFSDCSLTPTAVCSDVIAYSLGRVTAAAVKKDGSVYAWGSNYDNGCLGVGSSSANVLVPTKVEGIANAVDVCAGYWWTAALTEDNVLYTWGRNNHGALGSGSSESSTVTPEKIMDHVVAMSVSNEHGAAITDEGKLYTWGYGSNGELGQGSTKNSAVPAPIREDIRFAAVRCGSSHCAAIDEHCNLWTWGWNGSGQLAYSGSKSTVPLNITNLFSIINTYKEAVATGNSERFKKTQQFKSFLDLFGTDSGGVAGTLREHYRNDGLHIVNGAWTLIHRVKDLSNLDFSTDNCYDLVLSDLFNRGYGLECYENIQMEEVVSKISDCFTVYEAAMDVDKAVKAQEALGEFAKFHSTTEQSAFECLQKLFGLLDDVDTDVLSKMDSYSLIVSIAAPGMTTVGDLAEITSKYTLYRSHDDASMKYASLLRSVADGVDGLSGSTLDKSKAKSALESLAKDLTDAVNDDKTSLYAHANGSIANLMTQEGGVILKTVYKEKLLSMPYLAGTQLGLELGVTLADKVTGMDDISKYGALMDASGYLAQALEQVVLSRFALWEIDPCYDNMAAVKEAVELYYALEMLSCDYAIGYCQAIVKDDESGSGLTQDEKEAIKGMESEKEMLTYVRDIMRTYLDDTYSDLVSYSVDCPVTVTVEDLQGNVIARQSTGEQVVDEAWEGYFHLLGEELDCKAGVYNPKTQRLLIEGDDEGTMNVVFSAGSSNSVSIYQRYEDLPVKEGSSYTFTDDNAVLDGEQTFEPAESYRNRFTDVPDSAYYAVPVSWAVGRGITNGTSETTFSPNDACTRGQAVTFLWRANGSESVSGVENPFSDVKETDYYYNAVLWAYKNGITNGTTDTTFGPKERCNRAQIVTFLWRAEHQPSASADVSFGDVPSGAYYYAAVRWAVEKEVTNGTSETTFSPSDSCTRGQIVTFLYRALS